jgi:signal peptidase I
MASGPPPRPEAAGPEQTSGNSTRRRPQLDDDWAAGPAGNGSRSSAPSGDRKPSGPLAFVRELPGLLVVALVLALLIKSFLVQAFFIPSQSMEPTLQIGDRVLVNKVVYRLHPPERGDVIVFEDPLPAAEPDRSVLSAFWHWLTEGLGLSTNPEKDFIKRVIGLPGETIVIEQGIVEVNGEAVDESYLPQPLEDLRDYGPRVVPEGTLFVMGDNRANSNDSRFGLGLVPLENVIGRAFVLIWPPSRIGWLR